MSDQQKPESIADEALDGVQGGDSTVVFNELMVIAPRRGEGFITYGTETTTLKRPGMKMEVVNEDE